MTPLSCKWVKRYDKVCAGSIRDSKLVTLGVILQTFTWWHYKYTFLMWKLIADITTKSFLVCIITREIYSHHGIHFYQRKYFGEFDRLSKEKMWENVVRNKFRLLAIWSIYGCIYVLLKCLGDSFTEYSIREDSCPWQTHDRDNNQQPDYLSCNIR